MVYTKMSDKEIKPYTVRIAKAPYFGVWEYTAQFDSLRKAYKYAKMCEKRGYDAIDIICRNYPVGY